MCGGLCTRTPGLKPRVEVMPLRGVRFPGSGLTCEEIFALSGATGVCRGCGVTIGHPGRTQSWSGERGEYERLQIPTTRGSVMAASDSLECLVKEPVLTHQLWAALKGFHHKGPSPILVLTVHSSPVPLRLSWDGTPSWPPVVSRELNPQVLGTVKEGPPLAASCPQPCRTSRG